MMARAKGNRKGRGLLDDVECFDNLERVCELIPHCLYITHKASYMSARSQAIQILDFFKIHDNQ